MSRKRTFYALSIIALAVVIFGLAWAEQITMTTYYPSPYGVYKEFTTTSKTTLATSTDSDAKVGIGTDPLEDKLSVSGKIYATDDVCIDAGSGEQICLSNRGSGWQHSGRQILTNESSSHSWQSLDLSEYEVTGRALVLLKIKKRGSSDLPLAVRPGDDDSNYFLEEDYHHIGTACIYIAQSVHGSTFEAGTLLIQTDETGSIEWKTNDDAPVDMWLLGFARARARE